MLDSHIRFRFRSRPWNVALKFHDNWIMLIAQRLSCWCCCRCCILASCTLTPAGGSSRPTAALAPASPRALSGGLCAAYWWGGSGRCCHRRPLSSPVTATLIALRLPSRAPPSVIPRPGPVAPRIDSGPDASPSKSQRPARQRRHPPRRPLCRRLLRLRNERESLTKNRRKRRQRQGMYSMYSGSSHCSPAQLQANLAKSKQKLLGEVLQRLLVIKIIGNQNW